MARPAGAEASSRRPAWLTSSVGSLVAANGVPLVGVVFFGWRVGDVVLLYWAENLVVGLYNVLRMLVLRPRDPAVWMLKGFMIPFFMVHYGMFTAVHGLFVMAIFTDGLSGADPTSQVLDGDWGVWAVVPLLLWATLRYVLAQPGLPFAVLALSLSHGVSFITNFIGRGEWLEADPGTQMMKPYVRVVLLHVVLIGGGFLIFLTGTRVAGLLLLIGLKTYLDIRAHQKEHGLTG